MVQWLRTHLPIQERGDTGLIHGLGRCSRGGNDNLFQDSCLGNSMDRGAWGRKESDTAEYTHTYTQYAPMQKDMVTFDIIHVADLV